MDEDLNDYGQSKKTLLEENITEDLKTMESKLIDFNKKLKEIKDYSKELDDQSYAFFALNSEDIHEMIDDCEQLDRDIAQLGESLSYYNINKLETRQKINEKRNQFLNKLDALSNDLRNYIKTIEIKEKQFNDPKYDKERREHKENNNNHVINGNDNDYNGNTNGNGNGNNDFNIDDNKQLKVVQLQHNSEFLKKRRADLEEIKKTSSQVKSISEQIKIDVYKQGEHLTSIEDSIIQSNDNVASAENEIKKADASEKKSQKKLYWIIAIISFLVISAAVLSYLIYKEVGPSPSPTPTPPTPKPNPQ